ncbi:MAG: helix-turn-helix transcriptional regulator [Clostridia bacterium]|nr:helix-turn-helix transcriptional regulator [Clostridia bacterium]
MKFGFYLKTQRELAGVTQSELAKRTGLSQAAISRWEDDLRIPNIENCLILAEFYGITIDELIGREYMDENGK